MPTRRLGVSTLAQIVDSAGEGVAIVGALPAPQVLYVNRGFCDMFGYRYDELVGAHPGMLFGPKTNRTELERMRSELATTGNAASCIVCYCKDGREILIDWRAVKIVDADGTVRFICLHRDLTRIDALSGQLAESHDVLEQMAAITDMRTWIADRIPNSVDGARPFATTNLEDPAVAIDHKRVLAQAEHMRDLLRGVVEASSDAFWLMQARCDEAGAPYDFIVVDCNARAQDLLGLGRGSVLGAFWSTLALPSERADIDHMAAVMEQRQPAEQTLCLDRQGSARWYLRHVIPVTDGVIVTMRDVTDHYVVPEEVERTKKLEALGSLAGSVAHDFNNLLSAILGFARLAALELPKDSTAASDIAEVIVAGERSAALTRQLLAFSSRQALDSQVVDAAECVENMRRLLERLVGNDRRLAFDLHGPAYIRVDPSQLEQVVMNLVVNARDATPAEGTISVGVEARHLDAAEAALARLPPGDYALLTVTDNGHGMSDEVRAHIFEPFFSTKERGRGTGLGLSTVFGIVRQSEGQIRVESTPGEGTAFSVYIPLTDERPVAGDSREPVAYDFAGRTVLVVDDDDAVRHVCARMLRAADMHVLEAADGQYAVDVAEHYTGTIDVLLTDVVMPRLCGSRLADALSACRPDIRVLFMSGYANDVMVEHGLDPARAAAILQKPLTVEALLDGVARVLV